MSEIDTYLELYTRCAKYYNKKFNTIRLIVILSAGITGLASATKTTLEAEKIDLAIVGDLVITLMVGVNGLIASLSTFLNYSNKRDLFLSCAEELEWILSMDLSDSQKESYLIKVKGKAPIPPECIVKQDVQYMLYEAPWLI